MANRTVGKAKKPAKKITSGSPAPGPATAGPATADLKAECERLRSELQAAQAQIAAYEAQRRALADRVEWVIDSLHTLIEADE
jgi:hypothetical protein